MKRNNIIQYNNMKRVYSLLLFFAFAVTGFSQTREIAEDKVMINDKSVESWTAYFKDDIDLVRKSFIRYAKDKYDLKAKKGDKKNLILEQVTIPDISDKRGDLHALFSSEKKTTKLGLAFFVGYDIPINIQDNPLEMGKLKTFLKEFRLYYETEYFKTLISENQKRIKELSSDLNKNQQELKLLSKSISKAEKKISKEDDENVKFEITNQNIAARAKTQAIHEIITNLEGEIRKVSSTIKDINKSIKDLEKENLEKQ